MDMKPILFNTDMARAILDGRKTATRRVIKDKDIINAWDCEIDGTPIAFVDQATGDSHQPTFPCQYQPGDILYVRETFTYVPGGSCVYKASVECPDAWKGTWHPSIHMPKEAARLFLRVTDVRVERLWSMDTADALAEGMRSDCPGTTIGVVDAFCKLWDATLKPSDRERYGWSANPWVWVISFERISMEDAKKGGEG